MTQPPPNTPSRMATPLPPLGLFGSQLTEQIQQQKEQQSTLPEGRDSSASSIEKNDTVRPSSSKTRSLSHPPKPSLSPSPAFREPARATKDDSHIISSPSTPRRPNFPLRGLSLQMPPREAQSPGSPSLATRVPLSPKLDSSITYGLPASVLPRRTRGLDFARACTNLHHSTLAEQSSPDSSPTITGRGVMIPQRKGLGTLDSPNMGPSSLWSTMATTDRAAMSSSVSSVNMLDNDSGSTDSDDDDEPMDHGDADDPMITTPQVYKLGNSLGNPFGGGAISSPGNEWMGYSPAAASLMSFQRARLRNRRSRKSSSSGNSSLQSPGPLSPPLMKSIEGANGGYFAQERRREIQSRRESLSLGTSDLHLSDGMESDEGEDKAVVSSSSSGAMPGTPTADSKTGVIRRAVTRRSNMLPMSRGFNRIRAALQEEGAPIDSEARREAEVIRQVRESDMAMPTSPSLGPMAAFQEEAIDIDDMLTTDITPTSARFISSSFSRQAMKNGKGPEFWNSFDNNQRARTPPPFLPRGGSSTFSEDTSLGTPLSNFSASAFQDRMKDSSTSRSRSNTPQAPAPAVTDFTRKLNKRRREDDFDPNSFKRRAVSPGMSLQSSPVLPQSPSLNKADQWGQPPKSSNGERTSSGGSNTNAGGVKRVGLQGMTDTNDGLMNMSIE